jgi:sugar O-acyltransferase (sialic acid O-acetyltransferase NeuD family)
MRDIVLIGGGGHCRSAIDVVESSGKYAIYGILDASEQKGTIVNGYSVIGDDSSIPELSSSGYSFCITIGQINSSDIRRKIHQQLVHIGAEVPIIISKHAVVSAHAEINNGTVVFHHSIVNANSNIGECSIINTGAVIEHDVEIGAFCHISTGAYVNGGARIGNDVFLGSNSTVIQGVTICSGVTIGAGSLILRDICCPGVYVGNPIRRIK